MNIQILKSGAMMIAYIAVVYAAAYGAFTLASANAVAG